MSAPDIRTGTGSLDQKVAIVTGAARGTGLVTAQRMCQQGAKVWLADIADASSAAADLVAAGHQAEYHQLDVTDEAAWAALVAKVLDTDGRVDVLVNNAAILHVAAIADTAAADFERVLAVNLVGPFLGIKTVAPAMKKQGSGSIVNVSSIDGLMAHNGVAAYSSSKFALRGLTKTAAIELGEDGIRVNTVCPSGGSFDMIMPFAGTIDLERAMHRPKQSLLPDESDNHHELVQFAEMVIFLASDAAGGCTGGDYPVDRGHTAGYVIPGMPGEPSRS